MNPRAYTRARALLDWAPCAPQLVRARLDDILQTSSFPLKLRATLEALRPSAAEPPGLWMCRFPVVASTHQDDGVDGGLLTMVSTAPDVHGPRGGAPAEGAVELGPTPATGGGLFVTGLPHRPGALLVGRSGSAAAWLAIRARLTHRAVPSGVVVSADLVPGADGVPRLAPVQSGGVKARIVAREAPGARFILCGDPEGERAELLPPNTSAQALERLVWGEVAVADPERLSALQKMGADAFKRHDYATARAAYQEVVDAEGAGDPELLFEACLRLAAIEVHSGCAPAAATWYTRADQAKVSKRWRADYLVERITGLAGQAIDSFRPKTARGFLESSVASRAAEAAHQHDWERTQALGAWRRLYLLEGEPARAREVQQTLLELADEAERHRALLDLGFVALRDGDLAACADALLAARRAIVGLPGVYGVQSQAFLTWHAARLMSRGGPMTGLGDLLEPEALNALAQAPKLQVAGRWRVRGLHAALTHDRDALAALAAELAPFQRWTLGVFLLESSETREIAAKLLASVDLDLSEMPALAAAHAQLRAGELHPEPFLHHAAY
ncbi:MAG: hypothetical protein IPN01_37850 [Deltaproteobacteria bacterium]|nr:hypothetical protein [Deltaproteobacteria bacterium]